MISAIRHTGIVVANMEASLRFYVELLGFTVKTCAKESGAHIDKMLVLTDVEVWTVKAAAPDGQMIELLSYESHPRFGRLRRELCEIGLSHIAFTVQKLDDEYRRLSNAGVKFLSPPQVSGQARVAFCRDPDGNALELVEVLC